MTYPKITDDDNDTITATLDGNVIRSWEYGTEQERRAKMLMAREFAEGWYQAVQAKLGTKPSIPWEVIRPEFKWAARDRDGEVWAYVERPEVHGDIWKGSMGEIECLTKVLDIDPGTCDWHDSLVQRPEEGDEG